MIKEFDEVTLKRAVDAPGVQLPAGARGVVVAVYMGSHTCRVEFWQPRSVVLTVPIEALEAR